MQHNESLCKEKQLAANERNELFGFQVGLRGFEPPTF